MKIEGIKNIMFYNHYHNGDIHVSRGFIKYMIENFPSYNYFYTHKNSPNLLKDLNIVYTKDILTNVNLHLFKGFFKIDDTLYINTWYCSNNKMFFNDNCTFKTLYNLFKFYFLEIFDLNIDLIDDSEFLPNINYSKFNINNIDLFFDKNTKPCIFISNGDVLSGQSINFNFNPIIDNLSTIYPSFNFLLTNKVGIINKNNVYYTQDIINSNENDLNENSYISTKCNLIIGRDSGAYTFSYVKENILNENKLFLSFAYNDSITKWYDKRKATILHSNKMESYPYMINEITSIINKI